MESTPGFAHSHEPTPSKAFERVRSIARRCHLPGVEFRVTWSQGDVFIQAGIPGSGGSPDLWSRPWAISGTQTEADVIRQLHAGAGVVMRTFAASNFLFDGRPYFPSRELSIIDP